MGKLEDVGHSMTRASRAAGRSTARSMMRASWSQVGLPATLGCFCGAQPGLSDEDVGEQRERQEDDDGGREAAATLVDVEPDVCQGAGQGRRQRQTEAHPADTTKTPSRNTAPKALSGATRLSRWTRRTSAAISTAAVATPHFAGGAVGRSTSARSRSRSTGKW